MTIENFLVHQETRRGSQTEVDSLATRFAFRRENLSKPMIDDSHVTVCETFANIIIAEIKKGLCDLNGPWTNRDDGNMERVIWSIGCATEDEISVAVDALYKKGKWSNDVATIRLFAIGDRKNERLPIDREQQIEWTSIIEFCVDRFKKYRWQKASNVQWEEDGKELMRLALRDDTEGIRKYFDLPPSGTSH